MQTLREYRSTIVPIIIVWILVSSTSTVTLTGNNSIVFAKKHSGSSGGGGGSGSKDKGSSKGSSSDNGGGASGSGGGDGNNEGNIGSSGGSSDNGGGSSGSSNSGSSSDTGSTTSTSPPATEGATTSTPPAAENQQTTCPDGSAPNNDGKCPAITTQQNTAPPAASQQTTCPDGSTPDTTGNCPTSTASGQEATQPQTTQQQTTCPDGSAPDITGNCPTSTTATKQTAAAPQTLTPQTCPPLPIDANGKCPGIDARGGGLGLPPPPPQASEPFKSECVGEVYFNIHSNKCVSANIPKDDGTCVTGYEKSASDSRLCEPTNIHCPAGMHADGYAGCKSNFDPIWTPGDLFPSCTPGWHQNGGRFGASNCLPDENPTPTTQTDNSGGTIGTNIPAGQDGHILINPNGDGTCPAGSHKFGAVCDQDIATPTSGSVGGTTSPTEPDPIVAQLQDGTCPPGYSKFGQEICKDNTRQDSTFVYTTTGYLQDGTCPPGYHKGGKYLCFEISCKDFNQQSKLCKDYFSPPTSASKPISTIAPTRTGTTGTTTGTTTAPMKTDNTETGGTTTSNKTPAGSIPSQSAATGETTAAPTVAMRQGSVLQGGLIQGSGPTPKQVEVPANSDGSCPQGSYSVGSSGNAGQPGTGSIICLANIPPSTSPNQDVTPPAQPSQTK